jgi:hypothetical protein
MNNEEILDNIKLLLSQKDYITEELTFLLEEEVEKVKHLREEVKELKKILEFKNVGAKDGEEPTTIFQYTDGTTTRDLKINIK